MFMQHDNKFSCEEKSESFKRRTAVAVCVTLHEAAEGKFGKRTDPAKNFLSSIVSIQ